MKKITFLIIASFFIASFTQAQEDIPNNNFEEWSDGEPVDWNTLDQEIVGTEFDMVTQENENAYEGDVSVRMETIAQEVFPLGEILMPGFITLGEIEADPITQEGEVYGGVPYTGNPQSMSGYYKYDPAEGDSTAVGVVLYKWTGETRDTLGAGGFEIYEEETEWTEFEAVVEYTIWETPDTMNIIASSTAIEDDTPIGSVLHLDELTFNYGPTSIIEPDFQANFRVYPESYSKRFKIELETDEMMKGTVQLFNIRGRLLKSFEHAFYHQQAYISYNDLSAGVYIIRVVMENGREFSQKVEIH
ncbi:MAG: PCMD domain-containing protein [Bacteroidales bacterium]|nr:PCMD domain-containing protein [Bacteroidales bacterium]MCF8337002.1 PCMD domain-containing protein [Bacteroidales bacterium]